MYEYTEKQISKYSKKDNEKLLELLNKEGIKKDNNLEYTMGLFDGEKLIATGSVFKNTLRCMAVDSSYQGEGLLNQVVTHLVNMEAERGIYHLFLYTKCDKGAFFEGLGFNEIARADNLALFMENRKNGFSDYLKQLNAESENTYGKQAAIIMNANPFTLGHLHLVEKASSENDFVHLFAVSEDSSLVPFYIRYDLIKKGVSHLKNVIVHTTESYMISSATFPSYFIKESDDVALAQAEIDISIFKKIAETLNISVRYVGEEPFSQVTAIYNKVMEQELKKAGIDCVIIPRFEKDGTPVSASHVRSLIKNGDFHKMKNLVPESTYNFFTSSKAEEVINKIKECNDVIHH